MTRFVYFSALMLLLLLPGMAFAWFNDSGNDSCLVIESDRQLYRPREDGLIFPTYKIQNDCNKALSGTLAMFFEDRQIADVDFSGVTIKAGSSLDAKGQPVLSKLSLTPTLSDVKAFDEKLGFSLKRGWVLSIPVGTYYVEIPMAVPFEDGEFALTFEDSLDKSAYSTLDPDFTGAGTAADPFILSSCEALQEMTSYCEDTGVYFELGKDVDCSGYGNFTPVCVSDANQFEGVFDGKHFTISNMTISMNADGRGSMFSAAGNGARISNVGLIDFNVWNQNNHASALVGQCGNCDINNVYVYGATIASGGLYYAAGLVTHLAPNDSNVTNCYVVNSTIIAEDADRVGGVVGLTDGDAGSQNTIQNTWSNAVVVGKAAGTSGGILGVFSDHTDGNTSNYWDYQVSGINNSVFGNALTTANMFLEASYDANWNFAPYPIGVWSSVGDTNYPVLTQFDRIKQALYSPDANFWQIGGYDINAGLPYFNSDDQNIGLTFSILEGDSDRVTVDINYSKQNTEGSGSVLVKDLNLDADICSKIDWNKTEAVCSWDWNAYGVADSNYFILLKFRDDSVLADANFLASQFAVGVGADMNLLVYAPKDEKTNTTLSSTDYNYTISILDGNSYVEYDNLNVDENYYSVSKGTDYYVVLTVDTNNSSAYYARSYYLQYGSGDIHAVLQPFLVPVADGAEVTFYTKDATDNTTVGNILIEAYRVVEGLGRTNVETVRTDDSGTGTMSLLVDEEYELVFYDEDGVELFTKTILANFTTYYIYIDTGTISWTEPTLEWVRISGFPEKGYLSYDASGFDINIVFDVNGGTVSKRWLTVAGDDLNLLFNDSCTHDCNYHITKAQLDAAMEIRVTAFIETASGLTQKVYKAYIPVDASGYNFMETLQSDSFKTEWGCSTDPNEPCFLLLMISVMLTIAIVASAGVGLTTDRNALSLLAAAGMAIFVYLTWVPMAFFILFCLAVFGSLVISRKVF